MLKNLFESGVISFFENVKKKKYLFEYRSNIFLSRLNNFYIDVYYFIFNFDLLEFVEIVD